MKLVKPDPENTEEYRAFKSLMVRVFSVPREEMQRREAEYQRQAALSPNRRGPKPKPKPKPASRAPGA
jgi:hypothetical protein